MKYLYSLSLIPLLFTFGCACEKKKASCPVGTTRCVRTTAYTHTEAGGCNNAIGRRLSSAKVRSAAADWSRYPLGTKFTILSTGETCQIDDYGSALVGTNTIDLYKTSRRAMNNWGVRHEDIKILEWGSPEKSLEVLTPRGRNSHVRRMITSLRSQS